MEIKHRGAHLNLLGGAPKIKRLHGDRWRLTYRCELINKSESWFYKNRARIFADWNSLSDAKLSTIPAKANADSIYPNQCLVENDLEPNEKGGNLIVYFVYETLTGVWELEEADKPSTPDNGLETLTRVQVAKSGTTLPTLVVGSTTLIVGGTTLYLAGKDDDSDDRRGRVVTRWAEPGIIAMPEQPGSLRMPGTRMITMLSQGVPFFPKVNVTEWTYTSVALEAAPGTKAKLVSKDDRNIEGFMQYNRTYIVSADASGTITGQKYSVPSKIRVQGLGVITPLTDNISMTGITGGTISGTRATYKRTPAKSSWVDVDYTLEITTAPPAEVARAYDATLVSCGIKEERLNLRGGPGTSVTFGTDTNRMTINGFSRAFSASVRHEDLFGYYLAAGNQSGSLEYAAASIPKVTNNTVATSDLVTVKEQTSIVTSGDTDGNAYATTGVVEQKARPIFITYDGTVYWEVLKWTAPTPPTP